MKTPSWFIRKNFIAYLLLPVSLFYFLVSQIVFNIRKINSYRSKIPVICIGGALAGGVGKTPIVREITRKLPNSVVIMRGYKGGDEAKMLRASGIDVIVGSDRKECVHAAESAGYKYIIMDDGFQNPTIKKDISILVFDSAIGIGNGFMLPAGPLRDPVGLAKMRADAILYINPKNAPSDGFIVKNKLEDIGRLEKVFAFAGIGYPKKFFDAINPKPIKTVSFPDHYNYTKSDLDKILVDAADSGAQHIVTTEKDWVRLPEKYQEKIDFIPLKTTIEPKFYKWLFLELKK
jgi:tetraacyldisaccharide 4'-kinase